MPRPKNARPSRILNLALPADIGARLDLFLYSEAEQRIPFAAHQRFISDRVREFFATESLDLAEIDPMVSGPHLVRASPDVIRYLRDRLGAGRDSAGSVAREPVADLSSGAIPKDGESSLPLDSRPKEKV